MIAITLRKGLLVVPAGLVRLEVRLLCRAALKCAAQVQMERCSLRVDYMLRLGSRVINPPEKRSSCIELSASLEDPDWPARSHH